MSEIIAYACSSKPNHLWSAAQFNSALEKNRKDCDIPLVSLAAFDALKAENDRMRKALTEIINRKADLASPHDFSRGFNDGVFRARQIASAALEPKP